MRRSRVFVFGICLSAFSLAASAGVFPPVYARRAMIVTAEPHATRIGLETLRKGGNAVDAAVAVGLALAVSEPNAGNLGGGGFMLIRFADGRATFIDFRERAPAAAHRDMYLDERGNPTRDSSVGYRAVGVPGTVRGFELALKKYGTRKWRSLVRPAKALADDGFAVTWDLAGSLKTNQRLAQFPESKRIFLKRGNFFEFGDKLHQRDLAATLSRLAKSGPDEFYRGKTAKLIAADMKANGGLITLEDLRQYKPTERRPLKGSYRGYRILSAPPPSSGGAGVIQMLNMLEGSDFAKAGAGSSSAVHQVAEVMRRFFADRASYFGDTDFVDIPLEGMLSKKYAAERAETIDPDRATPSADVGESNPTAYESDETTHYSIVDSKGNAVAVTYTLNSGFGSGVVAKGTGVLLNNEMDDFTSKPGSPNIFGLLQSENNAIEPGKRPLSAMTPTIVDRHGKLRLVVGSPGGPTIISSVLQVVIDVLDFNMNIQQAVDYPRFHHQWMPDLLYVESHGFSPDTVEGLAERGHKLDFSRSIGRVMAIEAADNHLMGAADSRTEGTAEGF